MSITLLSESSACSFEPTGTATVTMTPLNGSWHNPSLPNQCQGHGHCHGHWHAGPVAGPSPVSLRGWPLAACSKGTAAAECMRKLRVLGSLSSHGPTRGSLHSAASVLASLLEPWHWQLKI